MNDSQTNQNLNIEATQSSPAVLADFDKGVLEMRGDSYPENSFEFFVPIISWVEEYLSASPAPLHLNLYLLYLNTSSVKAMMDIFDMLETAHTQGRETAVSWYYHRDNARIAELAEEFKEDCSFPFEIIRDDSAV